jgi:acetone carboxylase gamma subunit
MIRLDEYLCVDDDQIVCRKCGHVFCHKSENYKEHAREMVRDFRDIDLLKRSQSELIDRKVVFRQYFCPGCLTNIENETILEDAVPIHDKQLA